MRQSIVSRADFGEPFKIRQVSSAYWVVLYSLPLMIMPPISWFCLMRIAKISVHMITLLEATGSPCLHSLLILNYSKRKQHCDTAALNQC